MSTKQRQFAIQSSKRSDAAPARLADDTLARRGAIRLDPEVQARMEARLGHSFDRVRVHADSEAAELVSGLGARALTYGRDIAFAEGAYRPRSVEGQRLIAHELAHVLQQERASESPEPLTARLPHLEREASQAAEHALSPKLRAPALSRITGPAVVQLDKDPVSQPASQTAQTPALELTFVLRAPDDQYTNDVKDYVTNTLNDPSVIEVDNLQEILDHLQKLGQAGGAKVGRIRLIGHGSTTGGIKMTPKGEADRRFVTAEELEQIAVDKSLQSKAAGAMAKDAVVEFWGCYIGGTEKTTEAMSTLFQSEFRSTAATLRTGYDRFTRPPDKGETGNQVVTSSSEIDARAASNKKLKTSFDDWLLARYAELVANGDMAPTKSGAEQLRAMRELFDRSGGTIRTLEIEEKGKVVQRRQKTKWLKKWKSKKVAGTAP